MLKKIILWILALVITRASAIYQRQTGPTYPLDGEIDLGGAAVTYTLDRSHGGPGDQEVALTASDPSLSATMDWRRFPTDDPWTTVHLERDSDRLVTALPHQPPAGKLEYRLRVARDGIEQLIPHAGSIITRFKGAVPGWALLPHILFMFAAMLVSNYAGLAALRPEAKTRGVTLVTTALLALGGLVFGPIVQKYAFGEYWTGVPFGWDLTDNKTLIAFIVWAIAVWAGRNGRQARWWVFAAAVVMLVIFLVPHSMFGSELKYS